MKAYINIGLNIDSASNEHNTFIKTLARSLVARGYLQAAGYRLSDERKQSNTEPTLVLVVRNPDIYLKDALNVVAHGLAQDCVALYYPDTKYGELIGSKAKDWGEFNIDYFIMPSAVIEH